jgi:hypothetical protein
MELESTIKVGSRTGQIPLRLFCETAVFYKRGLVSDDLIVVAQGPFS